MDTCDACQRSHLSTYDSRPSANAAEISGSVRRAWAVRTFSRAAEQRDAAAPRQPLCATLERPLRVTETVEARIVCKSYKPTGSRMARRVCGTPEQWAAIGEATSENAEESMRQIRERSSDRIADRQPAEPERLTAAARTRARRARAARAAAARVQEVVQWRRHAGALAEPNDGARPLVELRALAGGDVALQRRRAARRHGVESRERALDGVLRQRHAVRARDRFDLAHAGVEQLARAGLRHQHTDRRARHGADDRRTARRASASPRARRECRRARRRRRARARTQRAALRRAASYGRRARRT